MRKLALLAGIMLLLGAVAWYGTGRDYTPLTPPDCPPLDRCVTTTLP